MEVCLQASILKFCYDHSQSLMLQTAQEERPWNRRWGYRGDSGVRGRTRSRQQVLYARTTRGRATKSRTTRTTTAATATADITAAARTAAAAAACW